MPALAEELEAEQHRASALGGAQDPHRHLRDDAELTLGADEERQEVVALRIEMGAAELDDLPVHQHDLRAEHVVRRDAVLEAMSAARVHGDVAADRAGDLARGIRRVEEAGRADRVRDGKVGDAGLDARRPALVVDFKNAVHFREAEHDCVLARQRPAAQRRAGSPGHDLDAVGLCVLENLGYLVRCTRQDHKQRKALIGRERVGLERASPFLVRYHRILRRRVLQCRERSRHGAPSRTGRGLPTRSRH